VYNCFDTRHEKRWRARMLWLTEGEARGCEYREGGEGGEGGKGKGREGGVKEERRISPFYLLITYPI